MKTYLCLSGRCISLPEPHDVRKMSTTDPAALRDYFAGLRDFVAAEIDPYPPSADDEQLARELSMTMGRTFSAEDVRLGANIGGSASDGASRGYRSASVPSHTPATKPTRAYLHPDRASILDQLNAARRECGMPALSAEDVSQSADAVLRDELAFTRQVAAKGFPRIPIGG